jgi:hypothetical protein
VKRSLLGAVLPFSLFLLFAAPSRAQLPPCYAGFNILPDCITARGLDRRVSAYQDKINRAMTTLGASYKIELRLVNNPVEAGYDAAAVGDVFTDVVRNEEMRNQSFIINVTGDFLERRPEILFEASALHEVCHIMNDDLTGYHRNGPNIEVAEERCVFDAVGESRYRQYLEAYARYQNWDAPTYQDFLQRVKNVILAPPPNEADEADAEAVAYFKQHCDGKEHLLVYNGELHDVSLSSTQNTVRHDPEKLRSIIGAAKPLIFFHNHPANQGRIAMFPSQDDFGAAVLFSSMAYRQNPQLSVAFRVVQLGDQNTVVSYGFKGSASDEIRSFAAEANVSTFESKRNIVANRLAAESFDDYLQHACPVDLTRKDAEVCRTHPQYFLWPSDRFFIHNRPQRAAL